MKRIRQYVKVFIKRILFRINAAKAVRIFSKVAKERGWEYFLTFGTLLGAYREHNFIWHDDDVDIAFRNDQLNQDVIEAMLDAGFDLNLIMRSKDDKYRHFSFKYKGVIFDLYGYITEENELIQFTPHAINKDWSYSDSQNKYIVCRVHLNAQGLTTYPFIGTTVLIPNNTVGILKNIYGEDFMTPRKRTPGYKSKSVVSEELPIEQTYAYRIEREEL